MKKHFMKKQALIALSSLLVTSFAFALELDNTQWKTIDDNTGKTKALVEFQKQSNGSYTATIKKLLDPNAAKICDKCSGAQKGKPMEGLTIVHNLKAQSATKFDGGSILDPKSGKTYKMKAEVADGGKKLQVRGYIGVAALGRTQTWHRAN
ncbi:hypothetical protein GWI33_010036 [Rhynchophorus ferrugineus]|uniref:DUF2147 domain-containing protein n=1 Tax=Rhynchophorus ferrugineus TaxID=354439 RepID=A0A834ICN2_RHYFE|nr:hypothetical protein GWI33_010036 [Rhynchophorus ferrugineus]